MQSPNLSRRAFLRGKNPRFSPMAIRPPWALSLTEFTARCERCDECIHACPERILKRGDGGYPETNFRAGACTFCGECAEVCKVDAFLPPLRDASNAWNLSVDIISSCLSLNGVVCRACGDHCEISAIRFRLQTGGVAVPQIDRASCTGCGACKTVCPINAIAIRYQRDQEEVAA